MKPVADHQPSQPWSTSFISAHTDRLVGIQVFGHGKHEIAKPVIVYFHGGLFNCGSVEDAAGLARMLADDCVVVCVDYPLAPQLHFPDTVEVVFDATQWVHKQAKKLGADPKQLFVAGDQAGGNLAAVVAMMARDRGLGRGGHLKGQILINPMLDPGQSTLSMRAAEDCPCRKAWADYLPVASDALHPYAAPLHSKRLAELAPALILTSDNDPLRDEAELYASRLIAAGVSVRVRRMSCNKEKDSLASPRCQGFHEVTQLLTQFITEMA